MQLKLSKIPVESIFYITEAENYNCSTVILPWDIHRYCDHLSSKQTGYNEKVENTLSKKYPQLNFKKTSKATGHECDGSEVDEPAVNAPKAMEANQDFPLLDKPAIIIDRHGNILLWYLPGILRDERQV